ncbi:hypodermin-A-like [Microplitis mediator]|uniref:hypodermin-A-like n=1 Tax=Microplitis mediator TaxID=375433 RepID=UPI0025575B2A|nr:hypodermin-A-like [Microplitis mediator]
MEFKLASIFLLAIATGVLATDIKINDAPYLVSIQIHDIHYCNGAIISKEWVITSGQCVKNIVLNFPYSTIHAGATSTQRNGSVHRIATYKLHEAFELGSANIPLNDIGLIQVLDHFDIDSTRQPIKLINTYEPKVHKLYNVTGWDIYYNDNDNTDTDVPAVLKKQKWLQIDTPKCNKYFFFYNRAGFNNSFVCAVNEGDVKNPCTLGDLGDLLVIDGYLVGLKSWKMDCDLYPHSPTLFTNVRWYGEWISSALGPDINILETTCEDPDNNIEEVINFHRPFWNNTFSFFEPRNTEKNISKYY